MEDVIFGSFPLLGVVFLHWWGRDVILKGVAITTLRSIVN